MCFCVRIESIKRKVFLNYKHIITSVFSSRAAQYKIYGFFFAVVEIAKRTPSGSLWKHRKNDEKDQTLSERIVARKKIRCILSFFMLSHDGNLKPFSILYSFIVSMHNFPFFFSGVFFQFFLLFSLVDSGFYDFRPHNFRLTLSYPIKNSMHTLVWRLASL